MRLHWFSPLPPAETAIAHYTARILPDLRARVEVVLWVDQPEWDSALEDYATIRRYDPRQMPWTELNCADVCIYHIGNNSLFHGSIWLVSRRHPGFVILHDLCLQHFFASLYLEQWRDHDLYVALMGFYYGAAGRRDAQKFCDGKFSTEYMVEHYPLTPLAIENALGVIVHTREGFTQVKNANRWPVTYLPLPYAASLPANHGRLEVPPRWVKGDPYRIVTFGYIGPNRQLDILLRALAEIPERNQFRLDVYGQLWDSAYVQSLIGSFRLERLVQLHGFVPEAELDHALSSAHLAVNLRYPSMGEASASQLRIWDHSLPSLVTHVGWYADLPEDTVAFVRLGREIKDIQEHLRAFLSDPAGFARMGDNGRRVLEERHRPQLYVQAIVNAAVNVQRFRSHLVALKLAQRVGEEMSLWTRTDTSKEVYRRVAEEIHALIL